MFESLLPSPPSLDFTGTFPSVLVLRRSIFKYSGITIFSSSFNLFFTLTQPFPLLPSISTINIPIRFNLSPASSLDNDHDRQIFPANRGCHLPARRLATCHQHRRGESQNSTSLPLSLPPSLSLSLPLSLSLSPPTYHSLTHTFKHQINAGEIAAQKDAKVNTIQKRFTTLKQRYNLNIQTTAVGSAATATPTRARAAKVTKTPTPKKTAAKKTNAAKAAAIAEQLEEEKSDEGNVKTEDGDEEMRNAGMSESS
jgi:hypothetical protein